MGEVYRARDSKLNRDVAIKVLSGAYPTDPERLSRFHREAQLLASLNHRYIAQIYGFEDFQSVGQPAVSALVLELVEGQSLAERIAQGAVPLEESLPIARQVATALAAAHERGIIHRDLKPANIMLTPTGTAKVLDFGIAKALAVHPGPDVRGGPGAAWTGDGRIVFSRTWLSGLSIVSEDGGQPTVLTTPDPAQQEIGHWWPSMLPDGHILFTVVTAGTGLNDARIALLDPEDGTYRVLFPGARASWMASGHLVFYRTGRYQVVPFDLSTMQVAGESYPVLEDAQELDPSGDWPQPVAAAPGGALAYLAGPYVPPSRLTWIDPAGARTTLAFAERPFVSVKLSPDGRRAAAASLEGGRLLIRLFDLDRGTEQVPPVAGMNWNPVWLADGRLSFTSMRKGDFDVYAKDLDRGSSETAVLTGPDDTDPVAWTSDGRLVFQGSEPDGAYPLKRLEDVREPAQARRLTEQHVENGGSLSPDDRWLAYHSAENGRPLMYVRPLAGNAPAIPLSPNTGEFPTFLRDGR